MKLLVALLTALSLLAILPIASAAPKGPREEPEEKTHTVAPGQTLAKIAKRYRISPQELRDANDLTPGTPLKPGTVLTIPSHDAPEKKTSRKEKEKDKEPRGNKAGQETDDRDDEAPAKGKGKGKGKGKKDDADKDDDKKSEPGHMKLVRGDQSWEGKVLIGKTSKVTATASRGVSKIFAFDGEKTHSVDPKLVALLAKISEHFDGRPIEILSGFRPASKRTGPSKHSSGAAVDLQIEGVSPEAIRDFVRSRPHVGVGLHPNGGFVHIDIRPTPASWSDPSKLGAGPQFLHDEPDEDELKEGGKDSKKGKATKGKDKDAEEKEEKDEPKEPKGKKGKKKPSGDRSLTNVPLRPLDHPGPPRPARRPGPSRSAQHRAAPAPPTPEGPARPAPERALGLVCVRGLRTRGCRRRPQTPPPAEAPQGPSMGWPRRWLGGAQAPSETSGSPSVMGYEQPLLTH